MLSTDLHKALAPFRLVSNRNALSPTYRSLEISPGIVRGCSNYAQLELALDIMPADKEPVVVDATAFLAVIASLPDNLEVDIETEDGVMVWSCGQAKGRLALLPGITMPVIERPVISRREAAKRWTPTPAFRAALELGAISCANDSMASTGMFGIVIDNRKVLSVLSCDGATISHATVMDGVLDAAPALSVISPEAAVLLRMLLASDGKLEFEAKSLYFSNGMTKCLIKQLPPLKHDLASMLKKYETADIVAEVPTDRITAFIRRVGALTENKRNAHVSIGASDGRMTLSFEEGTASSEEYYLVEGLEIPDLPLVSLDASKTARALSHIDSIILDHVDRQVIILRGGAEEVFTYMVAGKR